MARPIAATSPLPAISATRSDAIVESELFCIVIFGQTRWPSSSETSFQGDGAPSSVNGRPLTGSAALLKPTGRASFLICAACRARRRHREVAAYRKEGRGSLILKWFRSQVEQVKWLRGRRKREEEEGENRSFLKANGLSMDTLYCAEYYNNKKEKTCWSRVPRRY